MKAFIRRKGKLQLVTMSPHLFSDQRYQAVLALMDNTLITVDRDELIPFNGLMWAIYASQKGDASLTEEW